MPDSKPYRILVNGTQLHFTSAHGDNAHLRLMLTALGMWVGRNSEPRMKHPGAATGAKFLIAKHLMEYWPQIQPYYLELVDSERRLAELEAHAEQD